MITITLDDKKIELENNTTLSQLLTLQKQAHDSFAVAVNNTFIPKQEHAAYILRDNDKLVILTPMQGG